MSQPFFFSARSQCGALLARTRRKRTEAPAEAAGSGSARGSWKPLPAFRPLPPLPPLRFFTGHPSYCFLWPTSVSRKMNFFQLHNNPRCARGSRRNISRGGSRLCASRGSTAHCARGSVFPVRAVAVRFAPMAAVVELLGSCRSGVVGIFRGMAFRQVDQIRSHGLLPLHHRRRRMMTTTGFFTA